MDDIKIDGKSLSKVKFVEKWSKEGEANLEFSSRLFEDWKSNS
jgi:hypothetical protein